MLVYNIIYIYVYICVCVCVCVCVYVRILLIMKHNGDVPPEKLSYPEDSNCRFLRNDGKFCVRFYRYVKQLTTEILREILFLSFIAI